MAAAAVAPLVDDGGMAEGVSGLARALGNLGCDVTIAVPHWEGWRDQELGPGVRVKVLDAGGCASIWGEDSGDPASAARFLRFSRAVAEMAAGFDLLHVHDWHAAPALHFASRTPGVLTIHNLLFQGIFAPAPGLPPWIEGRVNFLHTGILAARTVLTVSPTYAREIQTPEMGELLDDVLRARRPRGIVNGIDTALWAPLPREKRERPLLLSLGRIDLQKGSDLLAEAIDRLDGVDVIVAGKGDPEITRRLQQTKAKVLGWVERDVAQRLLAAADMVIMPSRFEPCGIVQLYAQRFGALPIVRRTGGLIDTVRDGETGILFDDGIVEAVARGLSLLRSPDWPEKQARMMALPLGWARPAQEHMAIYVELLRRPRR
jgi:starch synthase